MKILLAALVMCSTPASAEMTSTGCNALAEAAQRAADAVDGMQFTLATGDAFHNTIPHMPEAARASAEKVEEKQAAAGLVASDYANALREFSKAIKDCGG